jgi:hypothetical protein
MGGKSETHRTFHRFEAPTEDGFIVWLAPSWGQHFLILQWQCRCGSSDREGRRSRVRVIRSVRLSGVARWREEAPPRQRKAGWATPPADTRQLTYRLLHRRRRDGPATLTASGHLHAFPSVRVRLNPRHSASRTPISGDDGSGTGVFASAEGERMCVRVMKASRRRPTGADNFHFENGKTETSQPREKKCCILFPFVRTGVLTIP